MRARWHTWACALLVAASAAAVPAGAADLLDASVTPVSGRPRSSSPIPVEVKVTSSASGLIEGYLEMTLLDAGEPVWRYEYGPMVIAQGPQRIGMLLPNAEVLTTGMMNGLRLRFVTGEESHDLGEHPITLAGTSVRSFVICVSSSSSSGGLMPSVIADRLGLRRFAPPLEEGRRYGFQTSTAVVAPRDFPTNPLAYCAYDIVFLGGEGLGGLSRRQLSALSIWVRAGGSLCIAGAHGVGPEHAEVLSELADEPFAARETGGLSLPGESVPGLLLRRCGLGRLAVFSGRPATSSLLWTRAALFLWKFRTDQAAAVEDSGVWQLNQDQRMQTDAYGRGYYMERGAADLRPIPIADTAPLNSALMSEKVEVVPLGLVVAGFLGLVLIIGPVDYFVLGLLRARRFTWIFFPVACIGFTLALVFLSNRYVGRTDHRRSLTVVDIGPGPTVLRKSRFELAFAARETDAVTDVRNALCAGMGSADGNRYYRWSGYEGPSSSVPTFSGRLPTRFTMRRRLRQWTPRLSRMTAFGGDVDLPGLDWDAVSAADFGEHGAHVEVLRRLQRTGSIDGAIFLSNRQRIMQVAGESGFLSVRVQRGPYSHSRSLENMIRTISTAPGYGLLGVVSQTSPTGGPNFEDLCVLDPSDPAQWLVLAVERRDGDYFIYRRLYCGESP